MTYRSADAHSARFAAAITAARAAGALLVSHYGKLERLDIEQKGLNDFVSNADREAEDVIWRLLGDAFPQDGFLGEETGLSGPPDAALIWCVDPLDGTSNFLKGAHNWCVSIGLWSAGEPLLGVIYDPIRDELFTGAQEMAATCNGRPIHVSAIDRLDKAALGLGHNHRVRPTDFAADMEKLVAAGASFRQVGAGALMLAYTAAGRVDSYFERHMWAWDAVAGLAIIRAAGGVSAPYPRDGIDLRKGDRVIAAGPALYPILTDILHQQ
ncbi:inositol monophosphatase family protein [Ensifer sp. YR511]|uniref:inositol monophosphatase family protein n=1 Tax=Ensifer sp. YR511 TaxID=1855294 RepID=UPI0008843DF2|nr:inositol monophosphatase family protein [Ensifer sp. YR511]SDN04174.1 myo-inositol-1(or 4)-monophosphatase [Ensifer sp. YR511]